MELPPTFVTLPIYNLSTNNDYEFKIKIKIKI